MNKNELNSKINRLTEKLRQEKPEIYTMLQENPITIPDEIHPEMTVKVLEDYIATLEGFLLK